MQRCAGFEEAYRLVKRLLGHVDVSVHCGFDTRMSQEFLQCLGRNTSLDCSRGIGMAKRVHAEATDTGFITELVEVCIIGTVLRRFTGSPVDEDKLSHIKFRFSSGPTVDILQGSVQ